MNIAIISASKSESLNKVIDISEITLEDMGVVVTKVDLNENIDVKAVISKADGVILATDMRMYNIPAIFQSFFETFEDINENTLKDKPVLPIVISKEYNAIDAYKIILSNLIHLDAIEVGKIINSNKSLKKSQIEDQIKKMYNAINKKDVKAVPSYVEVREEETKVKKQIETAKQTKLKNEDDIMELTELFSKQLSQKIGSDVRSIMQNDKSALAGEITVKQMTKNLVHYFQPQITEDMNSTYQINVTGDEEFEANLTIRNKDCSYKDGQKDNADVIINVDSGMWKLILMGSISAQKAFMTGKIKVKGDFVLLAKFDKIFKKM